MRGLKQENLVVILLDTQNRMIKKKTLFIGTVNQSIAHPREIFREAVRHSATGILIAHNHPSGDTTPSKEDKILTKKIVKNGVMIGIPLLDHLIIGGEKYYSFREQGEIG
jgi:DNA repair protein RadC